MRTNTCMLAVALLLSAGCETVFRPWKLSEVREGMTRSQVVAILGHPAYSETREGAEYLHYRYEENYNPPLHGDFPLDADTDRRLNEEEIARRTKRHDYAVKLVDGKVERYMELPGQYTLP